MNEIDIYLDKIAGPEREALQRVRDIAKSIVPEAEEVISYGMPTLKYRKRPLIHFAAFKDHMSIFPTSEPIAALEERLAEFKHAKGTLQFTVEHQIPEDIIRQLVEHRCTAINAKK